ncbi:AraC family transcriptional regulator [Leptolyngbya sp. FACHB-711]|uniref:AraC family transcriptional regulator n=1 Tax=unclassified Leptolyngbya TaxID=2650499 RepID=UPI0016884677|nr:AraC family transcriptional regulator [Leptolyngbya sp. FACHB-711]MBD1852608.1 AraC family transcriptional regulator [Cyanobacteria bacterium FACHB-502]MBD2025768.1 AraC family transcriptional regulator [Leptolyngbya sp. FACHB-711]
MIEISNPDIIAEQCQELATRVMRYTEDSGIHPAAIEQLYLIRSDAVLTGFHSINELMLAIVVQGQKEALLGEEAYQYGAMQYLAASVDLPLSGWVVEATPNKPFLGLKLSLDPTRDVERLRTTSSPEVRPA